ncbi:MAG: peptidylprolyl isomerase [Chloroflexi bacterium]|nr:peptidylprolyl isomerase [Chloroflexota bacterium]
MWYLQLGVRHRLSPIYPSEIVLNGIAKFDLFHHALTAKYRRSMYVVVGLVFLLFVGCSSEPIADFSATDVLGSAPFEVSFILGEFADAGSYRWDFGDGSGSTELEPTHTFEFAGEFIVTLTAERGDVIAIAQTQISVVPGEAGWIVIRADRTSASSFESVQFTACAFDVLGNPVGDANFIWSVDDSVGDIDTKGKFTAGTDIGLFENAITVEFERLGVTASDQADIEITEGSLHAFSIVPNELDIRVGRSGSINVQVVDEAGHVLDSALVLFTAVRDGDTVDSTGLFKPSTMASNGEVELVKVEVELDGEVIEATISGVIRPGILDQVHVSNLPSSLEIGESVQLVAFATDRFENRLEIDELVWSVSDLELGTITQSGLFTAGTIAGSHSDSGVTARATLNGIDTVTVAPVTIAAGAVDAIHIIPDHDSVPIAAGSPFVVIATDAHGNILEIEAEEYVYEYSVAGRGNETAVFIAGYEIGDFENAITVSLPAGVAKNDFDIVTHSDVNIRQRSSNIIAVEFIDQDGGGIFFIDLETAQVGPADLSFNNNGFVELAPAWSPDGSQLLYVSDPTGQLQVYALDLSTREIVQLTDVAGGVSMPSISPDGNSIAFVSLGGDAWQLYVADIPGDVVTNPITLESSTRISDDDTAQHILPFWSPDGTQILASQNTSEGLVRVMMFDPLLIKPPEVLGPFGSVGFGWTPDGAGVHVGLATNEGVLDIGTLDLDLSSAVFVESDLGFLVAAWSPDGSEIVAIDSLLGAGWLVDSDGSGLRRVVDSSEVPTRMSWRPREYGDPVTVPAFEGEPQMLIAGDKPRAPIAALDTSLNYSAVISTDAGQIEIELFDDVAPMTVENFINLSRIGFYDGLEFHRVITGFVSQAGDPVGDGSGGPGYTFNDEFGRGLYHDSAGVLSMANAGSNTNGSQFFISHDAATWLDPYENGVKKNCADDSVSCHTIFGRVTNGLDIVTGMAERDPETATIPGVRILSILIAEN